MCHHLFCDDYGKLKATIDARKEKQIQHKLEIDKNIIVCHFELFMPQDQKYYQKFLRILLNDKKFILKNKYKIHN